MSASRGGPGGTEGMLTGWRESGVCVFGAGRFGMDLARALDGLGVPVRAFVVSGSAASSCRGVPLWSLSSVPEKLRHLPLLIGVFNRERLSSHVQLKSQMDEAWWGPVVFPQDYYSLLQRELGWRFWLEDKGVLQEATRSSERMAGLFADELSRELFSQIVAYRTGEIAACPEPSPGPQYFPPELAALCPASSLFVDGGAFDGDTAAAACEHLRDPFIVCFEPDLANFQALTKRLRSLPCRSMAIPCGMSDAGRFVGFCGNDGEAGYVTENGGFSIHVVPLDDIVSNQTVGFIKLDVEGHERQALAGASRTIARDRPILAISAYHRWNDLWDLPRLINDLGLDYRLQLRVHGWNSFDVVCYAIPA